MADPSSKLPSSRLVYDGAVFRIEFYVAPGGAGLCRQKYGSNSFLLVVSRRVRLCLPAWEIRGRFGMNASSNI